MPRCSDGSEQNVCMQPPRHAVRKKAGRKALPLNHSAAQEAIVGQWAQQICFVQCPARAPDLGRCSAVTSPPPAGPLGGRAEA